MTSSRLRRLSFEFLLHLLLPNRAPNGQRTLKQGRRIYLSRNESWVGYQWKYFALIDSTTCLYLYSHSPSNKFQNIIMFAKLKNHMDFPRGSTSSNIYVIRKTKLLSLQMPIAVIQSATRHREARHSITSRYIPSSSSSSVVFQFCKMPIISCIFSKD